MAGRFGSLWGNARSASRPDREAARTIKEWVRTSLGAPAETALAVNEIACTDPSCPGVETVILVMEPGRKTRAVKIGKPLDQVTEEDVCGALAP